MFWQLKSESEAVSPEATVTYNVFMLHDFSDLHLWSHSDRARIVFGKTLHSTDVIILFQGFYMTLSLYKIKKSMNKEKSILALTALIACVLPRTGH